MADQLAPKQSSPFEFVMYEGDADNMRTVTVTPNEASPWIDPSSLKLRYRIGRGPVGDVWLATHHRSALDYEEYHEVAIKMLNLMKEDSVKAVLDKFSGIFPQCHAVKGLCRLHGISVINGKVSIVMHYYEGSVGGKMAKRIKGGNLLMPDVLRYGINLAQTIIDLHSRDMLILNLKPSNFLLDDNDQAVLGDFGVLHLLLGLPLSDSDASGIKGSPHYMSPEQWEPKIRGPVSFETDSWGFGCSILEMLTGDQAWCGRSVQQIYRSVVLNQEKPQLPSGLPPVLEHILSGCFEFDLRDRPLMTDILQAFKSSQDAVMNEVSFVLGPMLNVGRPKQQCYTEWYLSKDNLQEGDIVRSRKPPSLSKMENMLVPEGKVVGLEGSDGQSGAVLVRIHGIHDPLRIQTSTLERVTHGFAAGDWVRLREEHKHCSPVGILHSINHNGTVVAGFIGLETLWKGNHSQLQMAEAYHVGQFVRVKANVFSPHFEWPQNRGAWATGKVVHIHPNGCLQVKFPGRLPFGHQRDGFLADPAEVEVISFSTCTGVVKKYQHLEDFHWAVRPLLVALGLFTAMKMGLFVGKNLRKPKMKKDQGVATPRDAQQTDGTGNSAWLPPSVATIIFREGNASH